MTIDIKQVMRDAGGRRYAERDLSFGTVRLRSLTQREYAAIDQVPADEQSAWLIAQCQVDDQGRRVWADHQVTEIANLDFAMILEITRFLNEHVLPGGGEIEDVEKNSEIALAAG